MTNTLLTYWTLHKDGTYGRYQRGTPADTTPPGNVSGLAAVAAGGSVINLTWTAATDNVAVVRYNIYRNGTFLRSAPSNSFSDTGLTPSTTYSYQVTALDAAGLESVARSNTASATTTTGGTSIYRFPGDTRPKMTGQWYWGIDEFDQDPTKVGAGEQVAPEALAKTPAAFMRTYFTLNSSFSVPNGNALVKIRQQLAAGRIPWISMFYSDWANQATGASNTVWDNYIAYVEEQVAGPVLHSINHEPESEAISHGGHAGTELDWYHMQQAFRARMDRYALSKVGGTDPDAYKWKHLAFGPCPTAFCYSRGGLDFGIDKFFPNPTGNKRLFDFMGVDYYVQSATAPAWGGNWIKTVDWCNLYGYAIALGEWGITHRDPQAAAKMRTFYERCMDGTNDVIGAAYYNSSKGSTNPAQTTWILDNVSNGGLADQYVAYMKDPRSIHYWDAGFPKPAGL